MTVTLDASNTDEVEQDIAPPMRLAVTMPLLFNGQDIGLVVYVAAPAFTNVQLPVSAKMLTDAASELASALNADVS
jgi:hypothetical protein